MADYKKQNTVKETLEILTIIMIILMIYSFFSFCKMTMQSFIPGPWFRWPVVGNLPSYCRHMLHEQLSNTSRIYGAVYMLRFYNHKVVVVNNRQAMNEVFAKKLDFAYTPSRFTGKMSLCGGKIIHADLNVPTLKQHRKICESALHEFLTSRRGRQMMELEISEILREFRSTHIMPFNPDKAVHKGIINVILSAVFGERFSNENDPEYINISLLITALGELDAELEILELLSEKEFENTMLEDMTEKFEYLFQTYDKRLKHHEETLQEASKRQDIASSLIKARDRDKTRKSLTSTYLSDNYLLSAIHDTVTGELADTVATIRSCIIFLAKHPEYQVTVQQEIDRVGVNDKISIFHQDKHKFPFLQAVILESVRLASIKPLGLPHMATRDTTLMGYYIPRDTILVTNLWALHMDSNIFSEPGNFDPYRFLDSSGKLLADYERFIYPRRGKVPAGQRLAEWEVFFFMARILQEFSIELPEETTHSQSGASLKPYDIIARPRRSSNRDKFIWEDYCYNHIAILTQTCSIDT